jgi:hypothetical protein
VSFVARHVMRCGGLQQVVREQASQHELLERQLALQVGLFASQSYVWSQICAANIYQGVWIPCRSLAACIMLTKGSSEKGGDLTRLLEVRPLLRAILFG